MNKLTIHREKDESTEPTRIFRYEIDPAEILHSLLKRRRTIIGVVGISCVLAALVMILTPNRYTSSATILPSGKSDKMGSLRAIVGLVGGPNLTDDNGSALYPVILRSNLVIDSVLAHQYTFDKNDETVTMTLAEFFEKENPDRLRNALSGMTSISSNTRTGEINVSAETEYPLLSQAVVNQYLVQLERFNLYSRRSEAGERVRYLTREVEERRRSLTEAEDSLSSYQSRNRSWAGSTDPVILKEVGRLRREVEIKVQTLAYLTQEFEAAKLDAQKDVPVVRILDYASLPTLKSGPHRTITVLATGAISFFLIVCGILGLDLMRQVARNSQSPAKQELAALAEASFPRSRQWYDRVKSRLHRQAISIDK
jgi:uncharacterized protein involved in exopolysaccharide biosynthesis